MITTNCEGCCFLKRDEKGVGCVAQQLCCIGDDHKTFAPGYCRLCRSNKWAAKNSTSTTETSDLYQLVVEENTISMDLLVIFDETINNIEGLQRTLQSDWYTKYTKKVIIVDVTGFGNRKNLALQYLRDNNHPVPTVVDSSAQNEPVDERENTIRRISRQVASPFFLSIPAGKKMDNFSLLAEHIKHIPSRVVHWSIPIMIGQTVTIMPDFRYGLYITKPYKSIVRSMTTDSFTDEIRTEEKETDMGLSCCTAETWFV